VAAHTTGDHDAKYGGNLTEQHVRSLHKLASDFSCTHSVEGGTTVCRRRQDRVPAQCRSKTVIGRKVEEKTRNSRRGERCKNAAGVGALRRVEKKSDAAQSTDHV